MDHAEIVMLTWKRNGKYKSGGSWFEKMLLGMKWWTWWNPTQWAAFYSPLSRTHITINSNPHHGWSLCRYQPFTRSYCNWLSFDCNLLRVWIVFFAQDRQCISPLPFFVAILSAAMWISSVVPHAIHLGLANRAVNFHVREQHRPTPIGSFRLKLPFQSLDLFILMLMKLPTLDGEHR